MRRLDETDLDAVAAVLARSECTLLGYVHGSALRLGHAPGDVDVAVVLDGECDSRVRTEVAVALAARIEDALGAGPADVRVLDECPAYFQDLVVRTGRCLFERTPGARAAYEGRLLSEWLDFKPIHDEYNHAMLRHAKRGFHGR